MPVLESSLAGAYRADFAIMPPVPGAVLLAQIAGERGPVSGDLASQRTG